MSEEYLFGPYRLTLLDRQLRLAGIPVKIGSRSFDILVALLRRRGRVVTHAELTALVWPNTKVTDGSLRVHVATLRKAIGDASGGSYVLNVQGEGYMFAADVVENSGVQPRRSRLPVPLAPVFGRSGEVEAVARHLSGSRLVTIHGVGGRGKTTVAILTAERARSSFADGVYFVDLSGVPRGGDIMPAVRTALGIESEGLEDRAAVLRYVEGKGILFVLDGCEHVVEGAKQFCMTIASACPSAKILATSREVLRLEGEVVLAIGPLRHPGDRADDIPPETLTDSEEMLLSLTKAAMTGFSPDVPELEAIAAIARRVEGNPLAIELAAARAEEFGLVRLAKMLQPDLSILGKGFRSAPPRHQSYAASMDWSYDLLSEDERRTLRFLSVFDESFLVEEAVWFLRGVYHAEGASERIIGGLAAKSMLVEANSGYVVPAPVREHSLHKLRVLGEEHLAAAAYGRVGRVVGAEIDAPVQEMEIDPVPSDDLDIRPGVDIGILSFTTGLVQDDVNAAKGEGGVQPSSASGLSAHPETDQVSNTGANRSPSGNYGGRSRDRLIRAT